MKRCWYLLIYEHFVTNDGQKEIFWFLKISCYKNWRKPRIQCFQEWVLFGDFVSTVSYLMSKKIDGFKIVKQNSKWRRHRMSGVDELINCSLSRRALQTSFKELRVANLYLNKPILRSHGSTHALSYVLVDLSCWIKETLQKRATWTLQSHNDPLSAQNRSQRHTKSNDNTSW